MLLKQSNAIDKHRFDYLLLELKDYDGKISVRLKGTSKIIRGHLKDLIVADPNAHVSMLVLDQNGADQYDRYIDVTEIAAFAIDPDWRDTLLDSELFEIPDE